MKFDVDKSKTIARPISSPIQPSVREYPIVAYDTLECSAYYASESLDSTYP